MLCPTPFFCFFLFFFFFFSTACLICHSPAPLIADLSGLESQPHLAANEACTVTAVCLCCVHGYICIAHQPQRISSSAGQSQYPAHLDGGGGGGGDEKGWGEWVNFILLTRVVD